VTQRLAVSFWCAGFILVASAFVSMVKYKHMGLNAHAIDVYFYLKKPDTLLFVASEFRGAVAAFALLMLTGAYVALRLYRSERPWLVPRRLIAETFLIAVGLAVITCPQEAGTIGYYVRKNHFASSLLASTGDIVRLGQASPLKTRLRELPPSKPFPAWACAPSGPRPDIVVVLSESSVAPVHMPEWRTSPDLRAAFSSFDGVTHGLRVETYAGGTWISEVQFMTGLSPADLGWRRPYATLFLEDRVRHSLPLHLKACGYKSVAISPLTYNFVNEGPFMRSIGFDEVLDYKMIGAPSKHEVDDVYYKAALDVLARRDRTDDQPLFVFLMTMTAHSPYDYRYQPAVRVAGEPFGNDAETDEYLRRLAMARASYAEFLSNLRARADRRGLAVAEFGDHQPIVTRPLIESVAGRNALSEFSSRAYQTSYSATTINRAPAAALPPYGNLDLGYLGLTVLELAGLPLGPVFTEQKALREHCRGAFHTCADRPKVDAYLSRLTGSGLLDLP
jgi:phosphoglycerol transferase MdoB-like AlkP superfamily enzyme